MSITIEHLNKHFGAFQALANINLNTPSGKLTSLLGPSGCGKTTLLRIIAGLEHADSGRILFDGQDVTHRHVRDRQVGFVFQHYALFRHMSIFDNIAFGLNVLPRRQRPNTQAIRRKVEHLLELVQLPHLANARPHQLSGGQRQRIALARALAVEPKLLLLDEPFGALDAKVRKELRRWLRDLHQELDITSILVTHDQEEALEVSDQIVVMNHGRIEQIGSADTLYQQPANAFVAEFLGETAAFEGYIEHGHWHHQNFTYPLPANAPQQGQTAIGYIRPHEWLVSPTQPMLHTTITGIHAAGALTHIHTEANGRHLTISLPATEANALNIAIGQSLPLSPKQIYIFPQETLIDYAI